jgi:N-acetylglucosamine malate deacetylase 1
LTLFDVVTPIEKVVAELEPALVLMHFAQDANRDHRAVVAATAVGTRPIQSSSVRCVRCCETASSTEWAPPFPGIVFSHNGSVDITSTLPVTFDAVREYQEPSAARCTPTPRPRSCEALEAIASRHGSLAGVGTAQPFTLIRQVQHEGEPSQANCP